MSGLELMADHEPCREPCDTCDLFGELTPEWLARMAEAFREDTARMYAEQERANMQRYWQKRGTA